MHVEIIWLLCRVCMDRERVFGVALSVGTEAHLGGCQEREVIPRFNRLIGTDTGMLALRKRSTRPCNSFSSALHTKLPSKRSPSIPTCLPRSMKPK